VAVVIRLYHHTCKFHETVGNGCNLKLKGTNAAWQTVLFFLTGLLAVMMVLIRTAAAGIAI